MCVCVTDIEVACYGYEGIDAVKNALRFGMKMSTEDFSIKVYSTAVLESSYKGNAIINE